jgi:hypothetical protein
MLERIASTCFLCLLLAIICIYMSRSAYAVMVVSTISFNDFAFTYLMNIAEKRSLHGILARDRSLASAYQYLWCSVPHSSQHGDCYSQVLS